MKKIIIICALLFGAFSFSKAQTATVAKPEDEAVLMTLMMTKLLDLNLDQQPQVKLIYLNNAVAMNKILAEGKTDQPATQKKMKAVNDAAEAKLYQLLNDSQKEKFDKLKAGAKVKE